MAIKNGETVSNIDGQVHRVFLGRCLQISKTPSVPHPETIRNWHLCLINARHSHITKGWALVPAGSLLERASIDTIVHLCLRVPAAAQCLADTAAHKGLTDAGKIPTAAAQNVKIALSSFHASL